MKQKFFTSKAILLLIFIFFIFPRGASAWTYAAKEDNDTFGDPKISDDGNSMVIISSPEENPLPEIVYFKKSDGKPKWTFKPSYMIYNTAISSDGKYVAVAGSRISLLNEKSKKPLWTIRHTVSVFDAIALTPHGDFIVAGDRFSDVFLIQRATGKILKQWKLGSEDGVNDIALSDDGRFIVAGTDESINLIDREKKKPIWKVKTDKDVENVRISEDGSRVLASDFNNLYYFNRKSSTPLWKKTIKSYHSISPDLSADGKKIAVGTNTNLYNFDEKGNEMWHFDLKDGRKGDATISRNGNYSYFAQGYSYLYLFDNRYQGTDNRPFHIMKGSWPEGIVTNKAGNILSYEARGLTSQAVTPAVLVQLKDTFILKQGDTMKLHLFATNPGKKRTNAKVKIALSLPQFDLISTFAGQNTVSDQKEGGRSKALEYIAEALPGYRVVYDEDFFLGENDARYVNMEMEVPSLLLPAWVEDLLGFIGKLNVFGDVMDRMKSPLQKMLPDTGSKIISDVNSEFADGNVIYPLIGIGSAILYDDDGIIDQDSFFFIYTL